MPSFTFPKDARYFQVLFQAMFLTYGITMLDWKADWLHYSITIGASLAFNYLFESANRKKLLSAVDFPSWGFSVLISAFSLCLLLKTNHWQISLIAAFFTVASKYIFRFHRKHLFNPSAFGIVAVLLLTDKAWLSPGQWGNNALIFFFVVTLGTIVVTRVQKLDVSLAFLFTFAGLLFWRQVYILGWPLDHFFHSVATGSLLLFSFFMISDPRTSPDHPVARILWAVLIALVSFYLSAFKWQYNTPIWVLVLAAPLVPLLNRLFKSKEFNWSDSLALLNITSPLKHFSMRFFNKKLTASVILLFLFINDSMAFCGFYVSKADGTLKNKTSQVIMVRDGRKNVITMFNDYQGNLKDFAMVVPVPVVLKKSDIKVIEQGIFQALNDYSKPRLVEYYDQNPCQQYDRSEMKMNMAPSALQEVVVTGYSKRRSGVKIEAQYIVGEYDILILSAKESAGLKTWLTENGYKIPEKAEEVLEPYIKSNLKFFVVKVNEVEKKKLPGNFLRPIQIQFNSPKFMLPIRLGMANGDGDQDMIVYAFSKKGRVEVTNYRTVAVPTAKKVPLFVRNNFGNFYANVFEHQWKKEGKAIAMLEYAWDVSPKNYVKCDPCVSEPPGMQLLVQAGVWWINRNWDDYSDVDMEDEYSDEVHFTRLHVRYNRHSFPQDLIFQETPNKESYQARYIITHPATGDLSCDQGKKYLLELKARRKNELQMLTALTGKGYAEWDIVMKEDVKSLPAFATYASIASARKKKNNNEMVFGALGLVGIVTLIGLSFRRQA